MAELRSFLVEERVSHAVLVPTLLQTLLTEPGVHEADWSRLRYVIYGSSPIPRPVIEEATRVFGCDFIQSYGLTETTGGMTVLDGADHLDPDERRLRSAGRAFRTAEVRVVDPVTLEDVAPGARGEVLVRGPMVMKGYWRNPEATSAALTEDGWLRTGDGGSVDADGYLYLHDRLKDMIVSGGENVFPAEVESVMTGHPEVAQVAVVGVTSARWGESPLAVVVRTRRLAARRRRRSSRGPASGSRTTSARPRSSSSTRSRSTPAASCSSTSSARASADPVRVGGEPRSLLTALTDPHSPPRERRRHHHHLGGEPRSL